jgi:hypothetical protein
MSDISTSECFASNPNLRFSDDHAGREARALSLVLGEEIARHSVS